MGAFGLDSTSNTKQITTNVSDQGVNIGEQGNFASPGSLIVNQKGKNAPSIKLGKGARYTVNQGTSADDLQTLLGNVTQATGAQIAALSTVSANQLDKLTELLGQKNQSETKIESATVDAEAGSPKTYAWVAVAAIVAFAIFAWKK